MRYTIATSNKGESITWIARPKFIAIDKYSNDTVMPLDGVRKAEGHACESLATGAQRQLRALQRLYPPLADDMVVRGQVPTIGSAK